MIENGVGEILATFPLLPPTSSSSAVAAAGQLQNWYYKTLFASRTWRKTDEGTGNFRPLRERLRLISEVILRKTCSVHFMRLATGKQAEGMRVLWVMRDMIYAVSISYVKLSKGPRSHITWMDFMSAPSKFSPFFPSSLPSFLSTTCRTFTFFRLPGYMDSSIHPSMYKTSDG